MRAISAGTHGGTERDRTPADPSDPHSGNDIVLAEAEVNGVEVSAQLLDSLREWLPCGRRACPWLSPLCPLARHGSLPLRTLASNVQHSLPGFWRARLLPPWLPAKSTLYIRSGRLLGMDHARSPENVPRRRSAEPSLRNGDDPARRWSRPQTSLFHALIGFL